MEIFISRRAFSQGISHNSDVMCILLTEDDVLSEKRKNWEESLRQSRSAVEKLAQRSAGSWLFSILIDSFV